MNKLNLFTNKYKQIKKKNKMTNKHKQEIIIIIKNIAMIKT